MGLGAPAGAAVLRRLEQRRRLHKVGGAFASLQKVSVFVVDLAIWLGVNDGKGIGGYKNPIGVWFFVRERQRKKKAISVYFLSKNLMFSCLKTTQSAPASAFFFREKNGLKRKVQIVEMKLWKSSLF